ncbi:MAG: penicillin-binding transpeptidase domain-containing protein, partial [Akkermansia sp.]
MVPPQFGRNVPGHEAGLLRPHPFPQHHVRAHRQPRRFVQCHSIRTTGGLPRNISRTPALYLGTWEASPLDIASAYSVFANGGVRPTPYIIDHITDSQGQPRFAITKSKRTVYSQRAANITSSILQQVCKPGGTAGRITALGFKSPCGGKTGTTNNYTNAWFAGYTSNLTCSVWVGFDSSTKILEKGYGGTLALPVWVDIMLAAQKEG